MFDRILVVCTGNICRSPFAEALLRQLCPDKEVASAGTGALVGHAADGTALLVGEQMGVDMREHKAQQINEALCRTHDLILVMETYHQGFIARLDPTATGKTMLLGHWLRDKKIHDPYRQSEEYFQVVFKHIKRACEAWQEKISN